MFPAWTVWGRLQHKCSSILKPITVLLPIRADTIFSHKYSLIGPLYTAGEFTEAFLIVKCSFKLTATNIHCNARC